MDFLLDDSNNMLNVCYRNQNFKIINGFVNNKRCIVFISSNGLYFPNTYEEFYNTIVIKDRFEWKNISDKLFFDFEKIIFIRDVRKMFYVTGINSTISSIDKIINWLSIETNGYKTYLVGASAGGYLAMAIANCIYADAVIDIGGQCNLYTLNSVTESYYYINKHLNDIDYNKWYKTVDLLWHNRVPIFHMYSIKCVEDKEQFIQIKDIPQLYPIPINSEKHGQGLETDAFIAFLKMLGKEELFIWNKIYNKNIFKKGVLTTQKLSQEILCLFEQSFVEKKPLECDLAYNNKYKWNIIRNRDILNHINLPIIIYGAGKYGKELYESLIPKKGVYIYDIDKEKCMSFETGISKDGLKVFLLNNEAFIVISIQNENTCIEIFNWLISNCKISNNRIIRFIV